MTTHEQSLYLRPYSDMVYGVEIEGEVFYKTVEIRACDKKYEDIEKGDELILKEFDPKTEQFTGRELTSKVAYVRKYEGNSDLTLIRFKSAVSKMANEVGLKPICPGCDSTEDLIELLAGIPNYIDRAGTGGILAIALEDIAVIK